MGIDVNWVESTNLSKADYSYDENYSTSSR